MDCLKPIAKAVVHNGLLGAGIIGLYMSHRNNVPDFWRILSYFVACVGLQMSASYVLGYEEEEPEEIGRAIAEKVVEDIKPEVLMTLQTSAQIEEKEEELERVRLINDWKEETEKYFHSEVKGDNSAHTSRAKNDPQFLRLVQKSSVLKEQLSPNDIEPQAIVMHPIDAKVEGMEKFNPRSPTASQLEALKQQVLKIGRERVEQLRREKTEGQTTHTV